jgi:shikimate dehydrogenase
VVITGSTRIYTILAHPSIHVTAPIIYNHIFKAMGLDMVYISHDIVPGSVPETIRSFSLWCNLGGFNVTIPHKEAVAALVNSLCEVSSRIGVVNTVVRDEAGQLSGYNTDGQGAVAALGKVQDTICLMIGAGGAARAIVDALLHSGAKQVLIMNRSREAALRLCSLFADSPVSIYEGEPLSQVGVVVQATPIADQIPLGLNLSGFAKGTRILETIIRPTVLSEAAVLHEFELIGGHAMLYHQTGRNFELLTGKELPKKHLDDAFAAIGYCLP